MTKVERKGLIVLCVLALGASFIFFARGPVLEGKLLSAGWRTFYQLISVPEDFYTPLAIFPVNLDMASGQFQSSVRHRYVGNYTVIVKSEREVASYADTFDWGGRYLIEFKDGNQKFSSHVVGKEPIPLSRGFILLWYNVPRDVPRDREVQIAIGILEIGQGFQAKYGAATFIAVKQSDF